MKKNYIVSATFLQWFKLFFEKNNKGREYHPLRARCGRSMVLDSGESSMALWVNLAVIHTADVHVAHSAQRL